MGDRYFDLEAPCVLTEESVIDEALIVATALKEEEIP
jgi:hypothetical protein